jgi:hypothetical protein
MAERRILLSAAIAARLGSAEPVKARWVQPRRPNFVQIGRPRGDILPSDQDYGVTAGTVVVEEREPTITPTGVYDARGQMLCRVTLPIKVPVGFHIPGPRRDTGEVSAIVAEDQLAVTDIPGAGIAWVDLAEVEDDDGEEYDDEEDDG